MDVLGFSVELLVFLFSVSVVAGCIDTLAGGGGLISLPALIVSGVPPLAALGTNKLQGSMGTATATFMMLKKKQVRWQDVRLLMLAAFIGSTAGTIAVQFINTDALNFIIPLVLLLIAIYFICSPSLGKKNNVAKLQKVASKSYRRFVVPIIGGYDGMFGPGTGSFFALAGVSLRGQGLIESTAIAKTLNFATNIASLIVFLIAGKVVWAAGLLMMVGQFIGAWVGSHFLVKINPQYLRVIVVVMCLGMLAKYGHSLGWLA
ncbi:TSUP family transporter [Pelagibaculum spongiae]|uniref:Probable membrane transporter protein n=1 Tax=Pelagibaculum spongiae TaxID=2080658 RepID=A0A2V1GWS9_9GAMM|nr:TSUP family transporter [Pelagibaculum spongiae]PVZ63888.1 hypothetical protein DC094_20385 [Pelagibaculum spongiae]